MFVCERRFCRGDIGTKKTCAVQQRLMLNTGMVPAKVQVFQSTISPQLLSFMLKKMRTFYSLLPVFLPLLLLWPFSVQPSFPPVADNMVLIKGGTFLMGDAKGEDDEKPVHQVTVSDFYLSKYEVTVADFKAFVDATGYKTVAEQAGQSYVWLGNNWELRKGVHWRHDSKGDILHSGDYQHPVIHVSWDDA
ncbi:MAG: formylglycine-generating enzyme family protein, partial [Saprospiraceae bacterium]|nr:formylglycine-generating enzyme family protein [Saprospiraceae bacterium]